MSEALKGKRHSWRSGSTRPDVAQKIAAWWTPERREAKRLEVLRRNPNARPKLSDRRKKTLIADAGSCPCGATSRLDIHHKNRDKRDHSPSNLQVLCHRCHMQEHARARETGWDSYHRKRRQA